MIVRKKLLLVLFCSVLLIASGIESVHAQGHLSETKPLTLEDKTAIRKVIQKQLEAFQDDDGQTAFSLASPGIQERFRTAEIFLQMVQRSYQPVYRPQRVEFLDLEIVDNVPVQILNVTGPEGVVYQAFYPMEIQEDKTWKTNGCFLFRTKKSSI